MFDCLYSEVQEIRNVPIVDSVSIAGSVEGSLGLQYDYVNDLYIA